MDQSDQGEFDTSVAVLIQAGVEPGLIAKLHGLYSDSVVAMALLRSCASAEAKGQLPIGEDDIAATEAVIKAAFRDVYVADAIQRRESAAEYGPAERPEVVMRHDEGHGRADTEVRMSSKPRSDVRPAGHRPQTATMMTLCLLSKEAEFKRFIQSRLAQPSGCMEGHRVVDTVKEEAAGIAARQIKSAVGTA